MMNTQAKALGMNGTSFKNPEGLTETGHLTTARDLSLLATRLMQDFPSFVGYYAIKNTDIRAPLPPTTPTATCCCFATQR
jgi:serine-type D-Ala-D-Ala carboxypeptidase (penicillin-binding protein 5/6)